MTQANRKYHDAVARLNKARFNGEDSDTVHELECECDKLNELRVVEDQQLYRIAQAKRDQRAAHIEVETGIDGLWHGATLDDSDTTWESV